jgi:hypothetical protein
MQSSVHPSVRQSFFRHREIRARRVWFSRGHRLEERRISGYATKLAKKNALLAGGEAHLLARLAALLPA